MELGPRLVVAGTHSGVGKTTIATGLMAALRAGGRAVANAKVGPDFIDPGYHSLATGRPPRNLDPWICGIESMPSLAARAGLGADLLIIEGVMGLFDGAVDGTPSSTADVAAALDAPVLLVVDASSMSSSVAAIVRGFRDHHPGLRLAGVVLNRVGSASHATILTEALDDIGMTVVGVVRRDDKLTWRDRHLGLVPVSERPNDAAAALAPLAAAMAASCDLDAIAAIARSAPRRDVSPPTVPDFVGRVRVAVAGGPAFTFCYEDNLEALRAAGAEIVTFDPLRDEQLPDDIDGVIVGGGFPEVFGEHLAGNVALAADVRRRVANGLVTWAECGGLLWLAESLDDQPMVGAVPAVAHMTSRLTLGYRHAVSEVASPLGPAGTTLRGHEFHYSTVEPTGQALRLTSRFGDRLEGFADGHLLATYLHLHLGSDGGPAAAFVSACAKQER